MAHMNGYNALVPGILSQLLNLRVEIFADTSHLWLQLWDTWHRLTLELQAELLRQLLAEAAKCIHLPATKLQHRQTPCRSSLWGCLHSSWAAPDCRPWSRS